jgi:hypothetical protein
MLFVLIGYLSGLHFGFLKNAYSLKFFDIIRNDKSRCLVINNARGYVHYGHDIYFNPNRFIDTETWQVIIET